MVGATGEAPGATGEGPGVVSEVVSGVVSGASEVRNSLLSDPGGLRAPSRENRFLPLRSKGRKSILEHGSTF